jgi:hypothetical protein
MLAGTLWGCSSSHLTVAGKEAPRLDEVKVEQLGGVAGFGGPHLKSWGLVKVSSLSPGDRAAVEALFAQRNAPPAPVSPGVADQFRYRLTRMTSAGPQSIEASEPEVPAALKASVSAKLE